MKEKLYKIINNYGINNQQRKLQEEIFELQEAITLYEQDKRITKNHIIEELADANVLLKQIQLFYEINDEQIRKIMEFKVNRTLERINEE